MSTTAQLGTHAGFHHDREHLARGHGRQRWRPACARRCRLAFASAHDEKLDVPDF